jgi:hypothetical protein
MKKVKSKLTLIILFFLLTSIIIACENKKPKPIDKKVLTSVENKLDDLQNQNPIGIGKNGTITGFSEEELKTINEVTNHWLITLNPNFQISKFEFSEYITIAFKDPNDNTRINFFIPFTESDSHKNILLQGYDNSKVVYYVLEGDKQETDTLINLLKRMIE